MKNNREFVLKPDEIISKGYPKSLLFLILGVFVFFTALSAVWLYSDMYRPLSTHYSAVVSILSDIHETLVMKTVKMNLLFFIMICTGILLLGILYTHRIVGPLHRIRTCAKAVADGRLHTKITFRKKDAIHPFGDAFNEMADKYTSRIKEISSEAERMKESLTALGTVEGEGTARKDAWKKVLDADGKIKKLLNDIKI